MQEESQASGVPLSAHVPVAPFPASALYEGHGIDTRSWELGRWFLRCEADLMTWVAVEETVGPLGPAQGDCGAAGAGRSQSTSSHC